MTPKPSILPEWAKEIEPNGINGQQNVIQPPAEVRRIGWSYGVKPNRQWWNWFQRQCYLWIKYFDDNLDITANTFTPTWSGLTLPPSPNIFYYSRVGNICYFSGTMTWGGNTPSTVLTLTDLPFTAKNIVDFNQNVNVTIVDGPTLPFGTVLSGLIDPNTTNLRIYSQDISTGNGSNFIAGVGGQISFSGFYFIEDI